MKQINKKIIETTSLVGQKVLVSLVQEKPYLFSTEYEVEIVGKGKSILQAETLKVLVGKKEYSRLAAAARGF